MMTFFTSHKVDAMDAPVDGDVIRTVVPSADGEQSAGDGDDQIANPVALETVPTFDGGAREVRLQGGKVISIPHFAF